jgi:hypothetical protein
MRPANKGIAGSVASRTEESIRRPSDPSPPSATVGWFPPSERKPTPQRRPRPARFINAEPRRFFPGPLLGRHGFSGGRFGIRHPRKPFAFAKGPPGKVSRETPAPVCVSRRVRSAARPQPATVDWEKIFTFCRKILSLFFSRIVSSGAEKGVTGLHHMHFNC